MAEELTKDALNFELSPSLLFQFVLLRYLAIHENIVACEKLMAKIQHLPSPTSPPSELKKLENHLGKIMGSIGDRPMQMPWDNGSHWLLKLSKTCQHLIQNKYLVCERSQRISSCIDKMHTISNKIDETLRHLRKATLRIQTDDIAVLFHSLKQLHRTMRRFCQLIVEGIFVFREDENVLLFLVQYKDRFDALNGKDFVKELLIKLYPKGINELLKFLHQRFEERGFTRLLPMITNKVIKLDSSLLCRLSENSTLN